MTRTPTRTRIQQGLFLVALSSMLALGCELIVDFDRTKIPVESTETGPPPDATLTDTSPANDGSNDANDGSNDGGTEAGDATITDGDACAQDVCG